jgi:hypothetical protein
MGPRPWHIARAEYNKKVSDSLLAQYPDWALTTLYHSALHYAHSSLAGEPDTPKDERHPRAHSSVQPGARGTNQMVNDRYRQIAPAFMSLRNLSHRTRYDVYKLGQMTVQEAPCIGSRLGHFARR